GAKSLDDFCKLFHGGRDGAPRVVTYTFDDVVATLNQVAPYDWRGFLTERVEKMQPHAPLGGITSGGWKLEYAETVPDFAEAREEQDDSFVDLRYSLGFTLDKDGVMVDVWPGSPAAKAGLAPGMKLIAVNGQAWKRGMLHDSIRAAKGGPAALELLAQNGSF